MIKSAKPLKTLPRRIPRTMKAPEQLPKFSRSGRESVSKTTIIIAGSPIDVSGLEVLLKGDKELEVAGRCHSGRELDEALAKRIPDLAMVFLSLPGADLTETVARTAITTRVLLITPTRSARTAALLNAGASGAVTERSPVREIITAAACVAAGGLYVSASSGAACSRWVTQEADTTLLDREKRILALQMAGKGLDQIADELKIKKRAIENILCQLRRRLNVSNSAELARHAMKNGILLTTPTPNGRAAVGGVFAGHPSITMRAALSKREREVVTLISEGHSNIQIAEALGVSGKTISGTRAKIRRKLGISTIAGLTRYAIDNGITFVNSNQKRGGEADKAAS